MFPFNLRPKKHHSLRKKGTKQATKYAKYIKNVDSASIKNFMVKLFNISPSSGIVLRQLFSQYNAPFFKRLNNIVKQPQRGAFRNQLKKKTAIKSLKGSKLSQG